MLTKITDDLDLLFNSMTNNLSSKTMLRNSFIDNGINNLQSLCAFNWQELIKLPGIGPIKVLKIQDGLRKLGLNLKEG